MSKNIKEINGKELKEKIAAGGKIVCDFWASWCGPCRMLAPVMDEVAAELEGRAEFVKVNVDENSDVAAEFGIMSIPDVLVFEGGSVKTHSLGFVPKNAMQAFLEKNI